MRTNNDSKRRMALGAASGALVCAALATSPTQPESPSVAPNANCLRPSVSRGAGVVVFDSAATNLLPTDSTPFFDVYAWIAAEDRLVLLSAAPDGQAGDAPSTNPSVCAEGHLVVFDSRASNLVTPSPSAYSHIYLCDLRGGTLRRLPLAGPGVEPDGDSGNPRISADGRFVVFDSIASNLVPSDTNGCYDVFVHEIASGRTQRVSVASGGLECMLGGNEGGISGDGQLVVFSSMSGDVVADDTNDVADVFLHDRGTGQTRLLSRGPSGAPASGPSGGPVISEDGSAVAFASSAADLAPSEREAGLHVFRADLRTGQIACLTTSATGRPEDIHSRTPSLSGDGRAIAFVSVASGLTADDLRGRVALFLTAAPAWQTSLVTRDSHGLAGEHDSEYPVLSQDATHIAFSTRASNLVDTKLGSATICVRELATGTVRPILGRTPDDNASR